MNIMKVSAVNEGGAGKLIQWKIGQGLLGKQKKMINYNINFMYELHKSTCI